MVAQAYLEDVRQQFHGQKSLAEKALAQVADEQFFAALDGESNSLALIVKHIAGNLKSRWTDFYTSDGEKPDRRRDSEFEAEPGDTRASLMERWEQGWGTLFGVIDPMAVSDLERTVTIREEPHSVLKAVNRQLAHYAYHVGQIVFLAKHNAAGRWQSLTIPRGQSETFNARKRSKA